MVCGQQSRMMARALLPMRETDIGNELWRIEVDYRTGPVRLVNNRVSGLAAQIRNVPLFQGLIPCVPHDLAKSQPERRER
jgi:hypothetical protein